MSSESNQPEDDFSVIEELTAYLDGELNQDQIQKVETRLGEDTAYLAEMQSLQKTWDLLDVLPTTDPGTSFTKTTMELVVGEAVNSQKSRQNRSWVWSGRIAIMVATPVLLFATAFGVIRKINTDPDRMLIENLSVIENHPRYDSIECDLDFLQMLSDLSLFASSNMFVEHDQTIIDIYEPEDRSLIPMTNDERRVYVETLDVQKKLKLKRKLKDYQKKSDSERQRLKEFDHRLTQNENRDRLTSTLTAYYDWLFEIDFGVRSDLRDLEANDRIIAIIRIRDRQAVEDFGKNDLAEIPREDAEFILGWCESVFRLNERQIRDRFPAAYIQFTKDNDEVRTPPDEFIRRKARHTNLHSIVDFLIREDRPFFENLILDNREINLLYDILSTEARRLLDDQTSDQRRKLILNWVELANQSQRGINVENLEQFERRLSVKDRDRLEKLSNENYRETLKRMYIERRRFRSSYQGGWEREMEEILGTGDN